MIASVLLGVAAVFFGLLSLGCAMMFEETGNRHEALIALACLALALAMAAAA